MHSWWPRYSLYKYPTTHRERGPKFWVHKITIFIKNSKIFIFPWNFTIIQPKVHKHFQQTKNTQKFKKYYPKPWIQNNNFSRKSDSELDYFKAQLRCFDDLIPLELLLCFPFNYFCLIHCFVKFYFFSLYKHSLWNLSLDSW